MKVNCLVIDDDPISRTIVCNYINQVDSLYLVASCENPVQAMNYLHNSHIHIIFSDIEMPMLNGLEFIKSLSEPPLFIFITSHQEYALEGFEVNATDFLTKPFTYARFLKAVNKALELIADNEKEVIDVQKDYFFVKLDSKLIKLYFDEVLYVEAQKDYVKIYTNTGKPQLVWLNLKHIEEQFPPDLFVRTHRSYIVNISKVDVILNEEVIIGNTSIPLGMSYKENVLKLIDPKLIKR
ncbi:LytR/AlgR family response regulator transcription factor [Thermoflexibacter ruber]|uniref:DNA-binding response regulator, LytR/AlgR family n=1 Tax=Thermoflexibacter ruber TaxID=1003 RepID=A0A1I2FSA9_9BACT|nr:LytTR family DNA-binding domain-containing protein [Thermoflexibacter ruber]SFF07759.1 DNA-binding response regulator, LytR/AlgR family [Thermoflexibacter ruber]